MLVKTRCARRAHALASTVALIFLLTIILGVAISHLDYSSGVLEAYMSRFQARNALVSMTNLSLKWLAAEVKSGSRPRAGILSTEQDLTDFDSLLIFASIDFNGCEVKIYDLDYAADKVFKPLGSTRDYPPSFPSGYMIRATAEKKDLAPLTLEIVYEVAINIDHEGNPVEILDEKPVYWRELFRK